MIKGKQLRKARRTLRLRAHTEHPDLVALDANGPSVAAALMSVGIDVDSADDFVQSLVRKNSKRLAEQGLITRRQQTLYATALAYGIALGLQAAELKE